MHELKPILDKEKELVNNIKNIKPSTF